MDHPDTLKEDVKDYVETKVKLIKLQAIEKGGSAISGAIAGVLMAVFGLFLLLFLSLSGAFAISSASGHPYLGFLLIAGFYLLLIVGVITMKEKLITMPVINALLKKFYFVEPEVETEEERRNEEEERKVS